MPNPNMANREVCDLIFVDYATKKPFLNLDFANVTTTELTGESVFAYGGKGHPKRVQFAGERGGTITIETQIQTVKLWQLITGGEVTKSAKFVTRVETTVGTGGTAITLTDTPVVGSVVGGVTINSGFTVPTPVAKSKPVTSILNVTVEPSTSTV